MLMFLKDFSTHEESQFALTAVTIQNDRVRSAFGRLNPELNSPLRGSAMIPGKYLHGFRAVLLISRHEKNQVGPDFRLL
jgi:hypothetical protein